MAPFVGTGGRSSGHLMTKEVSRITVELETGVLLIEESVLCAEVTALCDTGKSHCLSLVLQDSLREMVTCSYFPTREPKNTQINPGLLLSIYLSPTSWYSLVSSSHYTLQCGKKIIHIIYF